MPVISGWLDDNVKKSSNVFSFKYVCSIRRRIVKKKRSSSNSSGRKKDRQKPLSFIF